MLQTILEILTAWLPPLHHSINIETPLEKAALFIVANLFGIWLYHGVIKPAFKIVWAIVVGLVCTISLHYVSIYAAYKFKRLNKLRWLYLIPYFFLRWLDFAVDGYKSTTITSKYYIWRGPFNWTLVAQTFSPVQLKELAMYKRADRMPLEGMVHLTPAQMRESDARDEESLNWSCFDKPQKD